MNITEFTVLVLIALATGIVVAVIRHRSDEPDVNEFPEESDDEE
jgi:hypothetical protein